MSRFALQSGRISRAGFACVAMLAMGVAAPARAQIDSAQPHSMAKDADPDWEVATVRPGDPNDKVSHINISGRHVMVESESVRAMLKFAYGVQNSQIVGAPEWIKTERWDVAGVPDVDGKPNLPQFQSMM